MRRFVPILIAGAAFIAMACGDFVAPTTSEIQSGAVRFGGALAAAKDAVVGENATYVDIVIPARGGIVQAGPYIVEFPAGAVCVESAGYGPDLWDAACETRSEDVPLTAAYWKVGDDIVIEFLADLRFDPSKYVVIYAAVATDSGTVVKRDILYWQRVADTTVTTNEAESDRTLDTYLDPVSGVLYRRVKHFSGYVVGSGKEECPEGETCEEGGE